MPGLKSLKGKVQEKGKGVAAKAQAKKGNEPQSQQQQPQPQPQQQQQQYQQPQQQQYQSPPPQQSFSHRPAPPPPQKTPEELERERLERERVERERKEAAEREEKNRRMRKQVLAEILNTEQEYVKDLDVILDVYFFPCSAQKDQLGLTDGDLNSLFSNLQTLKPLHTQFHENLLNKFDESEATGEEPRVGPVFIELSVFFKMYMQYCTNYPLAVKHYEKLLEKNKKFNTLMKQCEADARCKGLLFGSWVIKPVQRLCKYPLLLRELLAHSTEGHPDTVCIETAKAKIDEVVDVVNEGKRTAERQMKILEIQDLMDNIQITLVTPSRRFVRDGTIEVKKKTTDKGDKRHLFLFNDLVIVAKAKEVGHGIVHQKKARFDCLKHFELSNCRFSENSEHEKVQNGFEVTHKDQTFIFSCESKKEQAEWIADFKVVMKEMQMQKLAEAKKEVAQLEAQLSMG